MRNSPRAATELDGHPHGNQSATNYEFKKRMLQVKGRQRNGEQVELCAWQMVAMLETQTETNTYVQKERERARCQLL